MDEDSNLAAEIQQAWELNLIEFLSTDIELGLVMLKTCGRIENPLDRKKLLDSVKVILNTVALFENRISIPAVAAEFRRQANYLQQRLSDIAGIIQ
jgi:hypothetical protein